MPRTFILSSMYVWHLWCRFVHITPRYTQHWHWSVCCTVARRLVSWHTGDRCQVSVAGRWQLAARWCLLQIVCQPGASKGIHELDITEPHTPNQTYDLQWHYKWDVMDHPPCSPYLMPSNFSLDPLRSTWLASDLQQWNEARCHSLAADGCHWFLLCRDTKPWSRYETNP